METRRIGHLLPEIYRRLADNYGQMYWWPADEPFEVMVGAILTQSAAWRNVERAIANLKSAAALSPAAIRRLQLSELADIIHPVGYYNSKALKIKAMADWLEKSCGDDLDRLFASDMDNLRRQLLSVHGIGPETADSILLYAAGKPAFVIDAYTRRIVSRLGFAPQVNDYDSYQKLFTANLAADVRLFNEYHALLVELAKDACRKKPLCYRCCLNDLCWFCKEKYEVPE